MGSSSMTRPPSRSSSARRSVEGWRDGWRLRRPFAVVGGKPHGERRPDTLGALDGDVATEHLAEAAADDQSQAAAAEAAGGRRLRLGERLEQPVHMLRCDPDTGVGHLEDDLLGLPPGDDRDRAGLGELGGVAGQVEQRLSDLGEIGVHLAQPMALAYLEPVPVPHRQGPDGGGDLVDEFGHGNVSRYRSVRPASIFDRSSTSLMTPRRWRPAVRILARSGRRPSCPRRPPPPPASRSSR